MSRDANDIHREEGIEGLRADWDAWNARNFKINGGASGINGSSRAHGNSVNAYIISTPPHGRAGRCRSATGSCLVSFPRELSRCSPAKGRWANRHSLYSLPRRVL